MPSKIKNAISAGNVNVGFSAALRNAPLPEEKLEVSLDYDDIDDSLNGNGHYHFRRGNTIFAGVIRDLLTATQLRISRRDSNGASVASKLTNRYVGEILRYRIDSDNFIEYTISGAITTTNTYHGIPIEFRRTGITNINSVSNSARTNIEFQFFELSLPGEVTPPQAGLFGVLEWRRVLLVGNPVGHDEGDLLLTAGGRSIPHLTNDTVGDVTRFDLDFTSDSLLSRFASNLVAGSSVYIYRDTANILKYDLSSPVVTSTISTGHEHRSLQATLSEHILDANGIDASSVDVPIYLGKVSATSGGSSVSLERMDVADDKVALNHTDWADVASVTLPSLAVGDAVYLDGNLSFELLNSLHSPIRQITRIVEGTGGSPNVLRANGRDEEHIISDEVVNTDPHDMSTGHIVTSAGSHTYRLQARLPDIDLFVGAARSDLNQINIRRFNPRNDTYARGRLFLGSTVDGSGGGGWGAMACDGSTAWVFSQAAHFAFAFSTLTFERLPLRDFDLGPPSVSVTFSGALAATCDGETIWVIDNGANAGVTSPKAATARAYDSFTGEPRPSKNRSLGTGYYSSAVFDGTSLWFVKTRFTTGGVRDDTTITAEAFDPNTGTNSAPSSRGSSWDVSESYSVVNGRLNRPNPSLSSGWSWSDGVHVWFGPYAWEKQSNGQLQRDSAADIDLNIDAFTTFNHSVAGTTDFAPKFASKGSYLLARRL